MARWTDEQVEALVEAMWQVLDDMGEHGQSVCLAAKAWARIAYEPFRDKSDPDDADAHERFMSLDEAKRIDAELH